MGTKVIVSQYCVPAGSTLTGSDFAFINHFNLPMVITVELIEPDVVPVDPTVNIEEAINEDDADE